MLVSSYILSLTNWRSHGLFSCFLPDLPAELPKGRYAAKGDSLHGLLHGYLNSC